MITKRAHRADVEPTQLLIDPATPDGQQSGLHHKSAVNFINLFTLEKTKVLSRIGSLTAAQMAQADLCLKAALEL
jgi:mRNA interferase MazF